MVHCAPYEFWELSNSDGLNSVCMNNKQAWFCTCLYKLVHSSFGTLKTPAYPFESKTVPFMFWLSFQWQFWKSNTFSAHLSCPPRSNFNTSFSLVIGKLVESTYGNYSWQDKIQSCKIQAERKEESVPPIERCLWQGNFLRWTGNMAYLCLRLDLFPYFPSFYLFFSGFSHLFF